MPTLTPPQAKKVLSSPLASRARDLASGPRVYRVAELDGRWRGLVLSDLQPEEPQVALDQGDLAWSCTCGDQEPCVHVLALLYASEARGAWWDHFVPLLRREKKPQASSPKAARARGHAPSLDLFDEGLLQPSLFDDPPPRAPVHPTAVRTAEAPAGAKVGKGHAPSIDKGAAPGPTDASPQDLNRTAPEPFVGPEPTAPRDTPDASTHTGSSEAVPAQPPEADAPDRHRQPWQTRTRAPAPLPEDVVDLPPRFALFFSETLGRTDVRLQCSYGSHPVPIGDLEPWLPIPGSSRVIRRRLAEEEAFRQRIGLFLGDRVAWQRGPYAPALGLDNPDWGLLVPLGEFMLSDGEALMALGCEIRVLGKPLLGRASLKVSVSHEQDWFGIQAGVHLYGPPPGGQDMGDGEGIVAPNKPNASTPWGDLPLTPGTGLEASIPGLVATPRGYVSLGTSDLRRLAFLKSWGMDPTGALQASNVNLGLVEALYQQIDNRDDPGVQASHQALADITKVLDEAYRSAHSEKHDLEPDFPVPPQPRGLNATLRVYQLIGFAWLRTLHHYGYGACLADDMGLGKTMQTLALLCSLKEEGRLGPSLLIAPVVTLANWEAEIARFAPGLQVIRHQGQRRIRDAAELRAADLVIVSYQTLRNDLDLFASHSWDLLILDEAHYIKNASSQIFKAVRVLSGKHRLSLTGTPIENNSMELWAQFDFINPGLLGSPQEFQERFAGPIERKNDTDAAMVLRETVRPFILRRKKQEVLTELPDKLESVWYVDMDKAQAEVYESHRLHYQNIVQGLIDTQGLAQSRMEIFKYLLRLRQLAIAPVLAGPAFEGTPSAKLDALFLMLQDLVAEDNKVLVFSQFTSTLDLIATGLTQRGWDHAYLSGKTADRQAQIDKFRDTPTCKVFLLSLKAGGVGINLTQANYVVLFDPWWNPAAENQAVDRAYRMGQRRNVSAYRFIARHTIEEKILALQDRKSRLQEALVNPDASMVSLLDEETVKDLFAGD